MDDDTLPRATNKGMTDIDIDDNDDSAAMAAGVDVILFGEKKRNERAKTLWKPTNTLGWAGPRDSGTRPTLNCGSSLNSGDPLLSIDSGFLIYKRGKFGDPLLSIHHSFPIHSIWCWSMASAFRGSSICRCL